MKALLRSWGAWLGASTLRLVLVPMATVMIVFAAYGLWQLHRTLRDTVRVPAELSVGAYL